MKLSEVPDTPAAEPQQRQKLSQVGGSSGDAESTLGALWRGFAGYAQEGAAALGDAARQIPEEAGRLAGDVGRALMPGQGGAQAGGRVVGKVGDIAALASGGFAGPTMPPTGARVPLASQRPIVPGPALRPIPPRMLPAPQRTVGPGPWTSTGAGMMPPESPGAMTTSGPGPITPKTPPPPPAAGPMVEAGTPEASPLAMAIVKNDPGAIDRHLASTYKRAVRPGGSRYGSAGATRAQDRLVTSVTDDIIANRDNIRFLDKEGVELPAGRLPKNLDEFSQAIEQGKGLLFDQYDSMAQGASSTGIRVPLAPAIAKLEQAAVAPEVLDLHPNIAGDASRLARVWSERGTLSPKEMQKTIQNLNATQRNPAPTREAISEATMLQPVVATLREALNQAVMSARGPGYDALKRRYGAYLALEKDVATAVLRDAKNIPGYGAYLGTLASAEEFVRGVIFHSPEAIVSAAAIKGAQMGLRYLRSPNRAISRMFERRAGQGSMVGLPSSIPGAQSALQAGFATGRSADDRRESYEANQRGDLRAVQRSLRQ